MNSSITGKRLVLDAPAKINLHLQVTGRRDDGYHELVTWMQKLKLADRVELELIDEKGIRFECNDPDLPTGRENLAVKAAEVFFDALGRAPEGGLAIRLRKKVPVAAGLGGGSSDAGTVLKGLNRMYDLPMSEHELVDLAVGIGADVPFFVTDHSSVLATGVGERMKPWPRLKNWRVLLVNPGFPVSTAWVFKNYQLTNCRKKSKLSCFKSPEKAFLSLSDLGNDLETVTFGRYPEVREIRDLLSGYGAALSMMSGSGPTVFGLFADENGLSGEEFFRLVQSVQTTYGKRVFVTEFG